MSTFTVLVLKQWNYGNIQWKNGPSYGDYVEQLTFLLLGTLAPARSGLRPFAQQKPFRTPPGGSSLKMADEQSRLPYVKVAEPSRFCAGETKQRRDAAATVAKEFAWPSRPARAELQCRFENETIWLTQAQIAELFQTTPQNVTLHLKTIFAEGGREVTRIREGIHP